MTEIKKEVALAKQTSDAPSIEHENREVNEILDIDHWIETRKEFKTKVGSIMLEGSDYHVITTGGKSKKSLAKGGAEKIASIFGWVATFDRDVEALEMLGNKPGLVAFKCILTKNGEIVGQGRGANMLSGDPNKTLKMAQKSAFIDAVLRSSGLSDIYTQDLEDMPREHVTSNVVQPVSSQTIPALTAQLKLIADLVKQKGVTGEEIVDAGFVGDARLLTGGKGGTASELIEWLFQYKKQTELPTISVEDQAEIDDIGDEIN